MTADLTNHLWQSTLIALAAGLLTLAFRNNRAHVRYWLWLAASLKFLIPFSLLVGMGSYLTWPTATEGIAARIPPTVTFTVGQMAEPFPLALVPAYAAQRANWLPSMLLMIWACGFAAIVFMRLYNWQQIRRALRTSAPLE